MIVRLVCAPRLPKRNPSDSQSLIAEPIGVRDIFKIVEADWNKAIAGNVAGTYYQQIIPGYQSKIVMPASLPANLTDVK